MAIEWTRDDHEWSAMLWRIKDSGGGAVLSAGEVQLLERHPSYTEPGHRDHETISAIVREHYAAQPGAAQEFK